MAATKRPTAAEMWPGEFVAPEPGAAAPAAPAAPWPGEIGAPPQPPGSGAWASLLQGLSDTASGVGSGLYDLGALPQNLLSHVPGLSLLHTPSGREQIDRLTGAVGLPPAGSSLASDITQNVAGTLPTLLAGPLSRLATSAEAAAGPLTARIAEKLAAPAAGGTPKLAETVATQLAEHPVPQVAAGVGAGVGQAVGDKSDNSVVRIVLPMLGAVAGGGLAAGTGAAYRALTRPSAAPEKAALQTLLTSTNDPRAAIDTLLDYRAEPVGPSLLDPVTGDPLPPPDPTAPPVPPTPADRVADMRNLRTTAEVLDQPRSYQLEQSLRNQAPPPGEGGSVGSAAFAPRDASRQAARSNVLDTVADPNGPGPGVVSDALQTQRTATEAGLQSDATAAQTSLDRARDALGTPLNPEEAGPVLQTAHDRARAVSSDNVGGLLADVDPNNTTAIPTRSIREVIRERAADEFGTDPTTGAWAPVRSILERFGRTNTIAELQTLRSSLMRSRQTLGADANLGYVQGAAAGAIEDAINTAAERGQGGVDDAMVQRWNAFRDAAREHGATFGEDVGTKLQDNTYGRPGVGQTQAVVPGMFFKKGASGADSIAEFNRIYADPDTGALNPEAVRALQGHIAERVASLVDPTTGAIDPRNLIKFQDNSNYGPALRQLAPEQRPDLTNVQRAAEGVQQSGRAIAEDQTAYRQSVASLWLGRDVENAVGAVLKSGNPAQRMGELVAQLRGNPDAIAGLKRAVLDDWGRASATNTPAGSGEAAALRQGGAESWFNKNEQANRILFTPDEMARLQATRDDLFGGAKRRAQAGAGGSPTLAYQSNAAALQSMVAGNSVPGPLRDLVMNTAQNNGLVGGIIKGMTSQRQDRAMGALYEMMLNPEVAGAALRRSDPETMARLMAIGQPPPVPPTGLQQVGRAFVGAGRGLQAAGQGAVAVAPSSLLTPLLRAGP
jgi:hypothetical protein